MATTIEKQKLVEEIKKGFRDEDVFVQITPLEKKNVTSMIQLYTFQMIHNKSL